METQRKKPGKKNANGFGSVRKLSGNRRNPYQALVTVGFEIVNGKSRQIQKTIGYAAKRSDAITLLSDYRKNPYNIVSDSTFKDMYEKIDTSRMSGSKINSMKTAYKRSEPIHNMKVKDIKKNHLQLIADSMVDMSKSSQQEVVILWRMIFKDCMQEDLIQKDYSSFVTWNSDYIPRDKKPFTAEQVKLFSDDLMILCYTGMRPAEYLAVKTEDVYDGVIHGVGTKTDSSLRDIPIHDKIATIVSNKLTGTYLCEGKNGKMTYNYFLTQVFKPEMYRLGITDHTPHDGRRTFATFADKSGIEDKYIMRLLGHSQKTITQGVYVVPDMELLREQINKLKIV